MLESFRLSHREAGNTEANSSIHNKHALSQNLASFSYSCPSPPGGCSVDSETSDSETVKYQAHTVLASGMRGACRLTSQPLHILHVRVRWQCRGGEIRCNVNKLQYNKYCTRRGFSQVFPVTELP